MSSVDYTPILLAQTTDLQMRVTNLESIINTLKAELERVTGHTINVKSTNTVKTSVPLTNRPAQWVPKQQTNNTINNNNSTTGVRRKPMVAKSENSKGKELTIQDILKKDEEVTIKIRTSDSDYTTALATFNGNELNVTKCELAPSLVGMKTSKPGEVLYKFMNELKTSGHITRTFSIAPWRLCSVERDGSTKTLEELRSD